jgi:hypothetical protein
MGEGMTMNDTGTGTTRDGFGERAITMTGETHTGALVAAAQAAVNARFVMALQRPRNWDEVRVRLLKECDRPGFADVARYLKPVGKGVEGPSIRFAEACFRYMGNCDAPTTVTFEDRMKRILHVSAIDYETNASYSADITIEKTVERSNIKDRVVVAERKNSKGATVYIVEATEDELLNKQNALVSKAVRTLILRLIPGDIVDEGQRRCMKTIDDRTAKDPAAEKKAVVDGFAEIGVYPRDIEAFVGHPLDALQPAELKELRKVYATVRDGEAAWADVLQMKRPAKEGAAPTVRDLEEKIRAASNAVEKPEPKTGSAPHPPVEKGEVKPPARDWLDEAEAIKAGLAAVLQTSDAKRIAATREAFELWAKVAPVEMVEDIRRFLALVTGAKREREPGEEG